MILNNLSAMLRAFAPALGNHLWQSTMFAIAAGLLTLILRKNQARIRYSIWLAASMKFLIPFSLLVGMGSHLTWSHSPARAKPGFYIAMEEVSQPFTQPTVSRISQGTASRGLIYLLPAILAAVWLCGFLAVVFVWYRRWRRVSAAVREAEPLREGRELQALRRLERMGGMRKPIGMYLSRASLEPGVFGIARPVLVWPKGISERLENTHIDAILAHELWHVRRRDNLAAALHMLVEAIFWFHPLVWWLGSRLVEERERACDEAVLESGSDRQVYAESILKICEFCVESPLACVSGVTGADLKKRMVHIMTKSVSRKLDFGRKLLLSAAGLLTVATPIVFGLLQVTQARAASQAQSLAPIAPTFETASIKPNNGEPMAGFEIVGKPFHAITWKADRLMATNFTLHGLVRVAYAIQDDLILGGPDWVNSEGFDIDAKIGKSAIDEMQRRGRVNGVSGRTLMFQALLSDRFKLKFHRETRELPVYALVIPGNGSKIQMAKPGDTYPNGLKCAGGPCGAGVILSPESGKLVGQGVTIATLAKDLADYSVHRAVLDKTGLTDKYDFTLQWTPEESQPAILTALEEQLGLKLEPQKARVEVLVIDHAEEPSEPQAQNAAVIPPVFELASVRPGESGEHFTGGKLFEKPDGFTATNLTLQVLIRQAYGVEDDQVSGAPSRVNTERYDVEAKMDKSVLVALRELSEDQRPRQRKHILQEFLADRFKLALHRETQHLPAYALVIAPNGPKLQEARPSEAYANGFKSADGRAGAGTMRYRDGELTGEGVPVALLVRELSRQLSRELSGSIIEDKTGLNGNYDFKLQWTSRPSLFAALQEQLGIKLESQNGPGEILVIDHAERPSEN
jgi:bla regulator protein BlaR1